MEKFGNGAVEFGQRNRIAWTLVIQPWFVAISGAMNPNDIQSKIQAAALRFTNDLVAVFGEAFANVVPEVGRKTPVAQPARVANVKPSWTSQAPMPGNGKRVRRSDDQIMEVGTRVVKLLQANRRGLRIEQINRMLGTTTRQLSRPILKLLSGRRIRKAGERRATTYFAS